MGILPPGALLRDPRSPDLLNIRVVSTDDKHIVVSVGDGTKRRDSRRAAALRRWLLPARTAVAVVKENTPVRAGVVAHRTSDPGSSEIWSYLVETETGSEE